MKTLFICATAFALAACSSAPYPMNSTEFKTWSESSEGYEVGMKWESYRVNEPITEIKKYLDKKTVQCLNVTINPGQEDSHKWTVTYEDINEESAAYVLHKENQEIDAEKIPEEGEIKLAMRLQSISPAITEVELYYSPENELAKVKSTMKSWSKVRHVTCPKWESGIYKYRK